MQNILISGGGGFIGCHLCERLLNEGNKVICIDNFISGVKENINPFLNNPNFILIEHDIVNPLPRINLEINKIYHLGSPASPNKKSPRSYISHPVETLLVNSIGTYNLLELAKDKNARFLYASSSEVYGDPAISPQTETYWGNVNPNGVRSCYDEGKRFGEAMTMSYFRKFNVDIRIVRIFNTYGDRMQKDDGRVISNFINQALESKPLTIYGDGKQTRSYCFISDMVDGLIKLMNEDRAKGEVVNLGNPQEYTILETAEIIKRLINSNSEMAFEELPEDDPVKRKPNIDKAKHLLGFEPKISLEEGLKKTIEYFKNN